MKSDIQLIEVPIFYTTVIWTSDCSCSEAQRRFRSIDPDIVFSGDDSVYGMVQAHRGNVLAWVKDPSETEVLLHELLHVVFAILRLKDMAVEEETMCYLLGWLGREISLLPTAKGRRKKQ